MSAGHLTCSQIGIHASNITKGVIAIFQKCIALSETSKYAADNGKSFLQKSVNKNSNKNLSLYLFVFYICV